MSVFTFLQGKCHITWRYDDSTITTDAELLPPSPVVGFSVSIFVVWKHLLILRTAVSKPF